MALVIRYFHSTGTEAIVNNILVPCRNEDGSGGKVVSEPIPELEALILDSIIVKEVFSVDEAPEVESDLDKGPEIDPNLSQPETPAESEIDKVSETDPSLSQTDDKAPEVESDVGKLDDESNKDLAPELLTVSKAQEIDFEALKEYASKYEVTGRGRDKIIEGLLAVNALITDV